MGLPAVVEKADDEDDEHDEEAAVSGPWIGAVSETSDDDEDVAAFELGATLEGASVERNETDLRGEFVAPLRLDDRTRPVPVPDGT